MKNNNKIFIFILIIILILFFYLSIKNEGYENNSYNKTVCIVWQNKINKKHHQGLGDKFRGLIRVHQYCKYNNINFKIDASNDICGDFLKNISNEYHNDEEIITVLFGDGHNLEKNINKKLSKVDTVYVYTNEFYEYELDNYEKEYLKYLLEPVDSLKIKIDEQIGKLPENYGIQHVRFTDDKFLNDNVANKQYNTALNFIKSNYKSTDVLITNSNNFKKFVKDKIKIHTIDCEPDCELGHIGQNTDYQSTKNSFIDFFIICNSTYINAFSFYDFNSGFVTIPSQIYDIPILYNN